MIYIYYIDINVFFFSDEMATAEVALSPLLNHASFQDDEEKEEEENDESKNDENEKEMDTTEVTNVPRAKDAIAIETYLGTERRRIEVALTSYQNARLLLSKSVPIHGFILVYDTLKKSSFSILKVSIFFALHPIICICYKAAHVV